MNVKNLKIFVEDIKDHKSRTIKLPELCTLPTKQSLATIQSFPDICKSKMIFLLAFHTLWNRIKYAWQREPLYWCKVRFVLRCWWAQTKKSMADTHTIILMGFVAYPETSNNVLVSSFQRSNENTRDFLSFLFLLFGSMNVFFPNWFTLEQFD